MIELEPEIFPFNRHSLWSKPIVEIRDRLIYRPGRYLGFTNILVSAKTADLSASVGLDKTLLYSSHMQTTCARKHNEPNQDSYLAATLAGAFS